MSDPNFYEQQRTALRELVALIESRTQADAAALEAYRTGRDAADREVHRQRKAIATSREKETAAIEAAFAAESRDLTAAYETDRDRLAAELKERRQFVTVDADNLRYEAKTKHKDAVWTLDSMREANEKRATDQFDAARRKIAAGRERVAAMWADVEAAGIIRADVEPGDDHEIVATDTLSDLDGCLNAAEGFRRRIESQRGTWLLRTEAVLACTVGNALLMAGAGYLAGEMFAGIGAGVGAVSMLALCWVLRKRVRAERFRLGRAFGVACAQSLDMATLLEGRKKARHTEIMKEINDKHANERFRADATFQPVIAAMDTKRTADLAAVESKYKTLIGDNQSTFERQHGEATQRYEIAKRDCTNGHDVRLADAEGTFEAKLRDLERTRDDANRETADRWATGVSRFGEVFDVLRRAGDEQFPEWADADWSRRPAVTEVPRGIRFGRLTVEGNYLDASDDVVVPAYLPFPDRGVLTLKYKDHGRTPAVQALQAVMLRFLTAVPPGKVRFTIIDPVGLGDNFASFMHLADSDELLVTSRIWTEPAQISQRLEDITAHMETVIQKYLRNQYRTIEEYNRQAGEVAEPFRVLVVANFPTNFTPDSAKRLLSIAASGATCGVYTLISVDARQPMPQGFHLSDLDQLGTNFVWKDDRFQWKDAELGRFPIELDSPPPTELVTELVRKIGTESRTASRVQVPFDHVAPPADKVWTFDSRKGVSVPLGRAGATRKQALALGVGTSQHAVVAGKTGSGKSTLLHALITNAALHYSPDELEMYLIDFKKGVEFKSYAAHELPHARVIAIESEREFGISVLQRLDAELRTRGDLYRACGANDVNSYRNANPAEKLPRILLIVDEFQEFFVADDKLSQDAALLMDRLVRQGRAFGLHVLLGSQTLGGAYSLARSTIDQMAVRIALQCSEADAQLILNKDNAAARLLSRPGEAIYNDSSGSLEGNDLFQVVWLTDERKDEALTLVRERARREGFTRVPMVFEGNAHADFDRNPFVERLLAGAEWPANVKVPAAWLGEAIAIKDPTSVSFRPASGVNLLMVGQDEEAALAMMCASLTGLALQLESATFTVLDGTPADDVNAGTLTAVAEALPHRVRVPERVELAAALGELADEVKARVGGAGDKGPRFLIVHGLQRFRDLRKEEDFGYRRGEKVASPADLFATIYRDGPAVGIHVIVWCDSFSNVQRSLDRPGMRDFGVRVLFQMSATDSSNLIDTPIASRLGRNRALFFHDEMEQPEKFRPYGLPSRQWLGELKRRLSSRREMVVG